MKTTTITEALAELKVIDKRIEKKRQFAAQYALRPEQVKDPLEKDGGSAEAIRRELQAARDLEEEKIGIRRAIQGANAANRITINGQERPIADWLVWRRDVAPHGQAFLQGISRSIQTQRQELLKKGVQVATAEAAKPNDIVINLDEAALSKDMEDLEALLGTLDGQLSLKNATITVDY